jgi:hypothetical protein
MMAPMTSTNINDPRRDTADRVEELLKIGMKPRQIAKSLDVSTQRVYQIIEARGLKKTPA